MSRWIKLHTDMFEWEWYEDINVFRVFTHLLLKASYKNNRWMGIERKKGQLITGTHKLSSELGLGRQAIRTALEKLEKTGEITRKATNKYSLITIVNWAKYQANDKKQPTSQPSTNQQLTNEEPSTNHQLTTSIEYIEYIEGKEVLEDVVVQRQLLPINFFNKKRRKRLEVEELVKMCTRRNDKRITLGKLRTLFKKKAGFEIDIYKCDYSDTTNGVELWKQLCEHFLNEKIQIDLKDLDIFAIMKAKYCLEHEGVVKAMLLYIAYAIDNRIPNRTDFYLSKLQKFVEAAIWEYNGFFDGHSYDSLMDLKEAKEAQEAQNAV